MIKTEREERQHIDPYKNLAAAILLQAVKEATQSRDPKLRQDAFDFIRSEQARGLAEWIGIHIGANLTNCQF